MIACFFNIEKAIQRIAGFLLLGLGAFILLLGVSGCSSLTTGNQTATKKIPLYEQETTKPINSAGHATVVVYRQGVEGSGKIGDPTHPPINLYVNGDYHASLRPRSQVELALCAGSQRLYPLLDSTSTALVDKSAKGVVYDLKPGTKQYFRVISGADGVVNLEAVNAEDAQRELAVPSKQVYTISRFHARHACAN